MPRNLVSKSKKNSKENNTNVITQSNKKESKTSKTDDEITRLNNVISTRLETVFSQCLKVPPSVKRILIDKKKESSDYRCIYTKKENIENMIKLFDVAYSHRQTTELTFEMLTCITLEKACDEWNFCINSEKSHVEELLRESELNKCEEFANAETKDDDDVDNLKYNSDDLPPYTQL